MKRTIIISLLAVLVLAACRQRSHWEAPAHEAKNSIYHWKTTYNPTAHELQFLKEHQVGRMYMKFFDVSVEYDYLHDDGQVVPIATTVFRQQPDTTMEIVPVVFITVQAMERMDTLQSVIARKLIRRVEAMCKANHIQNVHEVQLDCDWTESTQKAFYDFCRVVGDSLHQRGLALSSTIRLHQLRQSPPPVDRGVLMVYNTGSIENPMTANSIISYDDVKPYLKGVDYRLPLDFAYPTFSWLLLFDGDSQKLRGIVRSTTELPDSLLRREGNRLVVTEDVSAGDFYLWQNDWLREESAPSDEVLRVKQLVDEAFAGKTHSNIIYHLDSLNLSRYNYEEIENIYR